MKQLVIIGEGQTEQAFCEDLLRGHFFDFDINIHAPTISKSHGGIVAWRYIKEDIIKYLSRPVSHVTLLIDYYGIYDKHSFPGWEESKRIVDKSERMKFLEEAMANDLSDGIRYRFTPYIQLHEFEGLLFCDKSVFDRSFSGNEFEDYDYLEQTLRDFDNPEEINEGKTTAPSKRLERILRDYTSNKPSTKSFWGPLIAAEIGLKKMRARCPRFNNWIDTLENI